MNKLIFCVGVYSKGHFPCKVGKRVTKEYRTWTDMLRRSYNEEYQHRKPTYIGCSVSDNFKNFQFFAEWCNKQIGFGNEGWQLDKDILVKGNKVYSEDSCVFVPSQINNLLNSCPTKRGGFPVGVSFHKGIGKFTSSVNVKGKKQHLGTFTDPDEAFIVYKTAKERIIKEVAEEYKHLIDPRVYMTLLEWRIPYEN